MYYVVIVPQSCLLKIVSLYILIHNYFTNIWVSYSLQQSSYAACSFSWHRRTANCF